LRIKSLEISGFKSFVDRVVFDFRAGITGIVGPNGCGKSNVVDAIRWAMGEQSPRRLRGKGMEDVIFAGSAERAPVGLAEVVLTFDNSEGVAPADYAAFSEIQVSRRLYRSGESDYLINKVAVRLRDVQDFFRDTGIGTKGYTIVEQGRIAEIVSAKPEERRSLIEEAAGISKYKARRQEAERKLQATEQNLVRVSDVLGEIRRQISSIERQARKAARYKRLRETQRLLDLSIASDDRDAMVTDIEAGRRKSVEARDAVTAAEAKLGECEAELERCRLELVEHERLVGQGNETLFAARSQIQELESRISYERRERASLAEANVARERERDSLLTQAAAAEEELERQRDELRAVEVALESESEAAVAAETEAHAAGEALRTTEAERDRVNGALVEALTSVARCEDRRAACEERLAEMDRRLRSADEQLAVQSTEVARADSEQETLEEGLRNLLAERDRLMNLLRQSLDRHGGAGQNLRAAARALAEVRERRETRRARLGSLREIIERREDAGEAARHLRGDGGQRHGVRALVRDVLAADRDVEAAVEAVLAERAEGLVVERPEGALSAIAALREAEAGRGVFVLPLAEEPASHGFVPLGEPLLGRVQPESGHEALARRLLSGVNLVDDLGEALRVYGGGRIPCTFVTRAGDVLSPDGVIRGGGAGSAGLLARAREVRELTAEVETLDAEVAALEAGHAASEATVTRLADELENLRNRHHTAALAVANHEKDLERTRERSKALGEARQGRATERTEFVAEGEALREEIESLERRGSVGREDRATRQRELEKLVVRIGSAGRDVARLEALASERRVQHQSRLENRDRLRTAAERSGIALGEAREWIARREREIAEATERRETLAASIGAGESALAEALAGEEQARLAAENRRDDFEGVSARARALDESARGLRTGLVATRETAQEWELRLRELEMRLGNLETQVRERWNVELVSWKPPVPAAGPVPEAEAAAPLAGEGDGSEDGSGDDLDERDAQREARANADLLTLPAAERRTQLEEVRKALQALGDVNLSAIEEHEELRERFRFLTEQKDDLETSIAQLRDAISRINRTSRKRFRETFDAVNERFKKNFPRMFRGGKASLSLTESEDVLEAGIEIMAQPPGKRLQSVNLLSGGEKTMTAIALLVSVFQVRPSPFFLLDEVDAALDDANVGRFNEMVQELARDSQFLLITHNKRTIEVADTLYGVTMEERGVSKLVGVELT
jgi:chromosome segregation protein